MKHTLLCLLLVMIPSFALRAQGIAYGSINNFDTVNDTGHECHGFEIEIEDCHSTDITYTYNYNHYGVPEITEDNSVAGHPKCKIRWASKKNPDGTWAAYTAIPSGPIAPTNGHMFTNPSVNFGGEHFGVGYRAAVTAVRYNWLIDNGSGTLVNGGAVQVSTPSFTYYPAAGAAAAQVQAVIAPPPPPAPPVKEFGKAVWVKEIKTTTHNNKEIKLRELVSDDPADPNDKNWANGEPDEVEVEWRILQKKTSAADGGPNGELAAAPEDLPGGDEVVTRRYEFYKYVGPLDAETGEAMGDAVGADDLHGSGSRTYADHMVAGEWVTVTTDMATVIVVGDYTGAQMAAVDADAPVGLIDHAGEGKVGKVFAPRTVVIQGSLPFSATRTGALPPGLTFNDVTGVLSGTPTTAGSYTFTITAGDGVNPDVEKNYTMRIAAAGAALNAQSLLDTSASPVGTGTTTGDGSFAVGTDATVTAVAEPGYVFREWTDNGQVVSINPSYTLTMDVNHSLVANFALDLPQWAILTSADPAAGGTTTGDGLVDDGTSTTVTATANPGYFFTGWTEGGTPVSASASYTFTATADRDLVASFSPLPTCTITASATAGGSVTGGGSFLSGSSTTVTATADAGYFFVNWTVNGTQVSANASYTFTVTADRDLVANFAVIGATMRTITTTASPTAGGALSGAGAYADGTSVTVVATPAAGYRFSKWKEGGTQVSTDASYTFTVSANRALTASFTRVYYVTAPSNPPQGGTTETDSVSYPAGDGGNVMAFPAAGWQFVNWTENGTVVGTGTTFNFSNVQQDRTYTANFSLIGGVNISTGANPATGGATSGGGSYLIDDNVMLTAVPNPGYAFVNWTEGGVAVSPDETYTFTAAVSRSLVAQFAVGNTITTSAAPATGGTTSGGGSRAVGSSVTVSAAPNPGYNFVNWTEGSNVVSASADYTFTVAGDRVLVAHFAAAQVMLQFDFDTATPVLAVNDALPLDQVAAGITATFSSNAAGTFTVQTQASTGRALSSFSGKYLEPGADDGTLDITFDQPMEGVTFDFATVEALNVALASDVRVTAVDRSSGAPVVVGSAIAHGTVQPGDSLPVGKLVFNSAGVPFDQVIIDLADPTAGARRFLVDNVVLSPSGSTGGSMLLANPNWNITLTDFGYSDYCLDNTPGFEGREYLSGEWGSAISYTRDGVAVAPVWMEPNFLFPDWQTNSDFHVVQGIHVIGANVDGLPVAQSVIANADLEITLRYEMVDTVTGTPMGLTPATAASAAYSVSSNRYVLNQSFTIKNISGVPITGVHLFQLLHGFTSQRGVYDNRVYAGKLGNYQFDATLAGVDEFATGAGSSDLGIEDYIGFHSKVQPTAFEIGHYGIEGNGLDDHASGKPSDGVHLSIENNWASAPYAARQGTDSFAPATRWVAGGQRWDLGSVAAGQSTGFDIVLSLLSGTRIDPGTGGGGGTSGSGSCNGGAQHIGGVDFEIDDVDSPGSFFGDYSEADEDEMLERENEGEFALPAFGRPGGGSGAVQLWNLDFSGQHTGLIHLTFAYNPALLPPGFDESTLTIFHYTGGQWEELEGLVDGVHHTVRVSTGSLSPFALGVVTPGSPIAIAASALPTGAGIVTGGGSHPSGAAVTLEATPGPGYYFVNWTEGGAEVSGQAAYGFTVGGARTLVANFALLPAITMQTSAGGGGVGGGGGAGSGNVTFRWPSNLAGWVLQESPDLSPGSWVPSTRVIQTNGDNKEIVIPQSDGRVFFRLVKP